MKGLYDLREGLCKFTEKVAREGEFSPGQIDIIDKALNAIKNSYKIEMYEQEEGGGNSKNGSYGSYAEDGGSYRRGSSRRSYAEDSYRGSYAEDSYRRGSSRHGEDFKMKLREMMENARDEREREAYRRVMMEMEE